jgi:hypothetical protein
MRNLPISAKERVGSIHRSHREGHREFENGDFRIPVSDIRASRKPASSRSHRLTPSGAHPSNISQLLLGVCTYTNLEDYYELGWGKGRRGVTMPPLRAYAKKNSPEGLRVEEGVRRLFRKSEGVCT